MRSNVNSSNCSLNKILRNTDDRLSGWLKYYEVINQLIEEDPSDNIGVSAVTVTFEAFNETFVVHLQSCPFDKPQIMILGKNEQVEDFKDFSYMCGYESKSSALVHGYMEGGTFSGTIHGRDGDFFLERLYDTCTSDKFVIIYRSSDIRLDKLAHAWTAGKYITPGHPLLEFKSKRTKRSTSEGRSCEIHAFADYNFFRTIGMWNIRSTVNKIYYFILQSNSIFTATDFNRDGVADKVGVVLTRITIIKDSSMDAYTVPHVTDSSVILSAFSKIDHSSFCLATLFTHRDLDEGVIGLAWQASSSYHDYPGGICQGLLRYGDHHYSYNTLLVTTMNHGRLLPDAVTALTTAHEIGHSFGSPHDSSDTPDCSPGGAMGVFLMHPYATDTSKPNNWRFSRCSAEYVGPVIANKGACLILTPTPRCGDGILQDQEDCDCGHPQDCPTFDPCCVPVTDYENACTLWNSSECSPAASICCTQSCLIETEPRVCSRPSKCMEVSLCDGVSRDCPTPRTRPDGTLCNQGTAVCEDGFCSLSRCSVLSLSPCSCMQASTECQLCCRTSDNICTPISDLGIYSDRGGHLYYPAGSSCRDSTGFCNEEHHCARPDKIDTIKRLKDLLKGSIGKRLRDWFSDNWGLVLVAIFIVLGLLLSARVLHQLNATPPAKVLAHQTARMLVLWQQAQFELDCIDEQLAALEEQEEHQRQELLRKKSMDLSKALARVFLFFPTVPRKDAGRVVMSSDSEREAVVELLRQGYPMAELPNPDRSPPIERPASTTYVNV